MSNAGISCFLLVETGETQLYLRRYRSYESDPVSTCPQNFSYHDASVKFKRVPTVLSDRGYLESQDQLLDKSLPEWPARCSCGYEFPPDDQWQIFQRVVYRNATTGEEFYQGEGKFPVGAVYLAWWEHAHGSVHWEHRGKGRHLLVQTPGGEFDADMKSSNGDGWTWTGTPPNVTVSPSVWMNMGRGKDNREWHGWIRDGQITNA